MSKSNLFFELGTEKYNKNEYRDAIKLFKQSFKNDYKKPASLFNIAICYIKLNQIDQAINLLKKALEMKFDSKYLYNLAYCYYMKKDYKKALVYFNYSWALDNEDTECEKAINNVLRKISNTERIDK